MLVIRRVFLLSRSARVTPKQLVHNFVHPGLRIMNNSQWPFDLIDFKDRFQSVANSSMRTENIVVNDCGEGKLLEQLIHSAEKRVLVLDVLLEL